MGHQSCSSQTTQHSLNKKRVQIYAILSQINLSAALMLCLSNVGSMTNFHDNTGKSQQRRKLQQGKGTLWISSSFGRADTYVMELSGFRSPMEQGHRSVYL